jgi:prepilin-type N-terminal cleavage/methylation domain-containing protein
MENKQDKGFTLVELLIVIVILGILATVTVFAVRGITDQGQNSACETDQRTVATALEAWYAQNGSTAGDPVEQDLVDGGFLVSLSDNYDLTPVGAGTTADPFGDVQVALATDASVAATSGVTGATNPC